MAISPVILRTIVSAATDKRVRKATSVLIAAILIPIILLILMIGALISGTEDANQNLLDCSFAGVVCHAKRKNLTSKTQKNKPPKTIKSAACLFDKLLCKAKQKNSYAHLLKTPQQNSHNVEKNFCFCECCTISAVWQEVQNMSNNIYRPPVAEALVPLRV